MPVATLRGHEAGLTCACVSGATLATCDARGDFRLWRLPNGDPTTTVRWGLDGDAILRCAFLPRGRKTFPEALDRDRDPLRLATAHYSREDDRGRVLVWRIGDGDDPVARVRGYEAEIPGGGRTIPGRIVDARVALARRRTKREHAARDDASSEGNDSDSSDDSDSSEDTDVLLACGSTGWVLGCDAASARTLYSFEEKCDRTVAGGFERTTGGVRRCALSPDGGAFATLRADGVVCVRRTSDGELVATGECRREENPSAVVGAGGRGGVVDRVERVRGISHRRGGGRGRDRVDITSGESGEAVTESGGARREGVEARGFRPLVGGRDCLRGGYFSCRFSPPSVELGDRVGCGVQSYNCVLNH